MGSLAPRSCNSAAVNENKKDPMDVEAAIEALNVALRLQQRSAIAYVHMAGSLVGFQFHGLAGEMSRFALAELDNARHLVEKITTLGGDPTREIAPIECAGGPGTAAAAPPRHLGARATQPDRRSRAAARLARPAAADRRQGRVGDGHA